MIEFHFLHLEVVVCFLCIVNPIKNVVFILGECSCEIW